MRALVFVALAGCAAQSLDAIGIACGSDSDCPQSAWCDLRFNDDVCRSLDTSGPPVIVYDGFEQGSAIVPTISVATKTTTIETFRLRNTGGSQTYVTVTDTGPPCLDIGSLTRSDGDLVDEGATLDADFEVAPAVGCASPAMFTITATASSRVFTFTAMISITP